MAARAQAKIFCADRHRAGTVKGSERPVNICRVGVCVWFTGLSGSGKSTTAQELVRQLILRERTVTFLDGDVVRRHLSRELGFSRRDRDEHIKRVGFIAAEIVHHCGIVVCATISPYCATRDEVRNMVGNSFVEVYMNTPLEVCEERDLKGLYARARRAEIEQFTGISDPYEAPLAAEIVLDGVNRSPDENVAIIMTFLSKRGFLRSE